jgi:hypothetical protein
LGPPGPRVSSDQGSRSAGRAAAPRFLGSAGCARWFSSQREERSCSVPRNRLRRALGLSFRRRALGKRWASPRWCGASLPWSPKASDRLPLSSICLGVVLPRPRSLTSESDVDCPSFSRAPRGR